MLKPAPDADPDETLTAPEPVLVSVTDINELLPTPTLPKFTALGFVPRCGRVPTPTRVTVSVGFDALLVIVTDPVAEPVAVGAKVAVNVAVSPAFKFVVLRLPMLKPVPAAVACEMAIAVDPELVSVTTWLLFAPTVTLPNETLPGVAVSEEFALVPVPARSRFWTEFGALSVNLILPVAPCGADGENITLNVVVFPAVIFDGNVIPFIVKPAPVICAALRTKSTFPPFFSVTGCVIVCPTFTLPNCNVPPGVTASTGSVPVPINSTASGELVASLTIERVPLRTPALAGAI